MVTSLLFLWSRVRESNPPLRLGKRPYYRYTNPALCVNDIITPQAECQGETDTAGSPLYLFVLLKPPVVYFPTGNRCFLTSEKRNRIKFR